jgi:hypothetical protein
MPAGPRGKSRTRKSVYLMMDPFYIAWALSFMAAMWFLPLGAFRLIIYRSGQVDHTPGMQKVARTILMIGVVALVLFGFLSVVRFTGG